MSSVGYIEKRLRRWLFTASLLAAQGLACSGANSDSEPPTGEVGGYGQGASSSASGAATTSASGSNNARGGSATSGVGGSPSSTGTSPGGVGGSIAFGSGGASEPDTGGSTISTTGTVGGANIGGAAAGGTSNSGGTSATGGISIVDSKGLSPYGAFSLDPGWRFVKRDVSGAQSKDFDDSSWDVVSTPHTYNDTDSFRVLTNHSSGDTGTYQGNLPVLQQPGDLWDLHLRL